MPTFDELKQAVDTFKQYGISTQQLYDMLKGVQEKEDTTLTEKTC